MRHQLPAKGFVACVALDDDICERTREAVHTGIQVKNQAASSCARRPCRLRLQADGEAQR